MKCTNTNLLHSPVLTFTCACVGVHPGRVEPASPTALTTSRTEALQARRSCASSLGTFTQSFLYRAWPETRGPKIGSRSALIVVVHVISWPPSRLRHVRGGVGRRRSLISSPRDVLRHVQTSGAFFARAVPVTQFHGCTQSLRLSRRMRRMLSLSKTSNISPGAQLTLKQSYAKNLDTGRQDK